MTPAVSRAEPCWALPCTVRDGEVYAVAQGPLSIGGFGAGNGDNSVAVNHLTVGRVPGGGMVESSPHFEFTESDTITLSLRDPDFVTATRLADAITAELAGPEASVIDPGTVVVKIPAEYTASVPHLMARLEPLTVDVDGPARVRHQRADGHRSRRLWRQARSCGRGPR